MDSDETPIGPTKLTRMPSLTRAPRRRVFTLARSLSVAWQEARAVVITISFVIYSSPPISTVPGLLIEAAVALSPLRELNGGHHEIATTSRVT